jgi:hypothetical protein
MIVRLTSGEGIIIGLIIFYSLCFLAGLGKLLVVLFPLSSFLVAIYFYFKFPSLYISFSFWLLFFSPLIRRLIDYQSGHLTFGPWNLVSLLVSFITIITLVKEFPKIYKNKNYQKSYSPFAIYFASLLYGLFNGLIQNPLDAAIVDFLGRISPFCFGFHLFANWQNYPEYRRVIKQSFFWGVLLMGIYGMWQFCTAPPWDVFWMVQVGTTSFGQPEPFGIRTYSSMNSPQAFASAMLAGLLLLFNQRKTLMYFPATIFGYLTFMLSRARAGWLGFLVGLFVFTFSLKSNKQIQIITTVLLLLVILSQLIYIEPFSSVILERFSSLSNADSDASLNARTEIFQDLIYSSLVQVVGKGLGTDYDAFGGRDGSILQTLFVFGWIGTIFFLSGLLLLLVRLLFQFHISREDTFANTTLAISLGMLSQIGFNLIFLTSIGMIFWSFIGITLASQSYYYDKHRHHKFKIITPFSK